MLSTALVAYAFALGSAAAITSEPLRLSFSKRWVKRHDDFGTMKLNTNTLSYFATLQIGSNAQPVEFTVDTGSSDTWIPADTFNTNSSSTWKSLDSPFEMVYADQTGATGHFGTDTVTFGSSCACKGLTLTDFQIGIADNITGNPAWALGLGFPANEFLADRNFDTGEVTGLYDNFPIALKKQGLIQATVYSLWLDTQDENDGEVLFGAVDHAKYSGTLAKVPLIILSEIILPEFKLYRALQPDRFVVVLNGISLQNSAGDSQDVASGASIPIQLDSGSSLGMLPADIMDALADALDATFDDRIGSYTTETIPSGSITFDIAGVPIAVPLSTWIKVLDFGYGPQNVLGSTNGNLLGGPDTAQIDNGIMYILGDAFLAGAYVVYDLDHFEIAIAQAKTGVKDTDIETVTDGIPRATEAPNYSATSTNTEYSLATPTLFKH